MSETIRCRRLSFVVIPFPSGLINEGSRGGAYRGRARGPECRLDPVTNKRPISLQRFGATRKRDNQSPVACQYRRSQSVDKRLMSVAGLHAQETVRIQR
jgi:hypothetical protein